MRTAMPLVTCSRITLRLPSARSLSISTPRLMGPGCIMMALGCSQEARVLLRPNMPVYSPSEGKWLLVWRSCCIRRSMTTSAPSRALLRSCETVTPKSVNQCGTRADGPQRVTAAPSLVSAWRMDRAGGRGTGGGNGGGDGGGVERARDRRRRDGDSVADDDHVGLEGLNVLGGF